MQREGDEEAWRSIVENFGERAELGPDDVAPPAAPTRRVEPGPVEEPEDREPTYVEDLDTFVPPEPPPLPIPEPDRGIAWIGVIGSPLLLLVCLVVGIDLPEWVGYLMVAWFVGGFCYLVARMPREPRDPWDDGSRV